MQVTRNKYNNNYSAFGSKKLMPVVVRDMNNRPLKAWFSQLQLSDPEDVEAMEILSQEWQGKPGIKFIKDIYKKFNKKNLVFAIEKDCPESLPDRILCLSTTKIYNINIKENPFKKLLNLMPWVKVNKEKIALSLNLLQSSPDSCYHAEANRIYKGAGEASMYGLVSLAYSNNEKMNILKLATNTDDFHNLNKNHDSKIDIFKLYPQADQFYAKFKMKKRNGYLTFNRHEMAAFIKKQIAKTKAILKLEAQRWK